MRLPIEDGIDLSGSYELTKDPNIVVELALTKLRGASVGRRAGSRRGNLPE